MRTLHTREDAKDVGEEHEGLARRLDRLVVEVDGAEDGGDGGEGGEDDEGGGESVAAAGDDDHASDDGDRVLDVARSEYSDDDTSTKWTTYFAIEAGGGEDVQDGGHSVDSTLR